MRKEFKLTADAGRNVSVKQQSVIRRENVHVIDKLRHRASDLTTDCKRWLQHVRADVVHVLRYLIARSVLSGTKSSTYRIANKIEGHESENEPCCPYISVPNSIYAKSAERWVCVRFDRECARDTFTYFPKLSKIPKRE